MDSHNGGDVGMQHGHDIWMCNGEPLMTEGGSWIGHIAPGVVIFIWGLHWSQGAFRKYFNSRRSKGQEYRAQTTYTLWRFPAVSESIFKVFLPMIAMSIELYFAHRGGWRTLVCPAGTKREGHFYGPHMGNWQHAAMYPAFILSGIVDLVGEEVELPPGTQQVLNKSGSASSIDSCRTGSVICASPCRPLPRPGFTLYRMDVLMESIALLFFAARSYVGTFCISTSTDLAPCFGPKSPFQGPHAFRRLAVLVLPLQIFLFLAFFCEALLMGLHKKHTPLDIAVHSVLFYSMMATAVLILLEAMHPRNFLLSCGRITAMFVQGAWFVVAAHIMFGNSPAWDEDGGADMAPAMMVPVYFVAVIVAALFFMCAVYLIFHVYYKIMDGCINSYERTGLLDEDRVEGRVTGAAVPMSTLGGTSGTSTQV